MYPATISGSGDDGAGRAMGPPTLSSPKPKLFSLSLSLSTLKTEEGSVLYKQIPRCWGGLRQISERGYFYYSTVLRYLLSCTSIQNLNC